MQDKENETPDGERARLRENVTVTLTLTSQAADDVMSVLRNLANVLRIPVPTTHSITERSSASNRLGLYRVKSKDGKEGGKFTTKSSFERSLLTKALSFREYSLFALPTTYFDNT